MTTITDMISAELAIAYNTGPQYSRESVFPFVIGDTTYQTLGDAIRNNDPTIHIRDLFEFQKKNPDVAEIIKKKHLYVLPELPEPSGQAVHFLRKGIRMYDPTWLQLINSCLVARCQELESMNESLQKHITQTRAKGVSRTNTVLSRVDMAIQNTPMGINAATMDDIRLSIIHAETQTDPIEPIIKYVEKIVEIPVHVPVVIMDEPKKEIETHVHGRNIGWALLNKPTWKMSANKQNGKSRRGNARFLETYNSLLED